MKPGRAWIQRLLESLKLAVDIDSMTRALDPSEDYTDTYRLEMGLLEMMDVALCFGRAEWRYRDGCETFASGEGEPLHVLDEVVMPREHGDRRYFSDDNWRVEVYNSGGVEAIAEKSFSRARYRNDSPEGLSGAGDLKLKLREPSDLSEVRRFL